MRMVRSSRSYATTGGNDAAESKANTGSFKSTWVLIGGGTALVGAMLATMMGSPDATVAAAKNADPEGVAHMRPPNQTKT
ncbi:hypothetical protein HYQ44_006192 [Verticillium longisporum]|nr:hypothetical protein HYQ44_006192 [Verticillium longisporum]